MAPITATDAAISPIILHPSSRTASLKEETMPWAEARPAVLAACNTLTDNIGSREIRVANCDSSVLGDVQR